MPKVRTISYLLALVEEVTLDLSRAYEAQRLVRRQVYPEIPPKDFKYNHWEKRYRVSTIVPKDEPDDEYTLLVINFGYSEYFGKVCDSWSSDWYKGVDDPRLWERVWNGKSAPAWPGNDMEKLAYEGLWRKYLKHSEKTERLALEHYRLDRRTRQLEQRRWTLMAGIQRIVEAEIRKQEVNRWEARYDYKRDRKVGPRVLLDGNRPCYFEGDRLVFGEITDTYTVSTGAFLEETDRNYGYGDGSNASLRHKIRTKQREREQRRTRNGR